MLEYDQQDEGNHPGRVCRNIPELMEVLSAEIRFEFLRSLARRPMTVTELARELALRQPCASQHLGQLRRAMLVTYEQIKKSRVYRLSDMVEAVIESGVVYLKLTVAEGDSILVRTHFRSLKVRSNCRSGRGQPSSGRETTGQREIGKEFGFI